MADEIIPDKRQQFLMLEKLEFVISFLIKKNQFIHDKCSKEFYLALSEKFRNEFNITLSPRQLCRYVNKARSEIKKINNVDKEANLKIYRARLMDILKRCQENGDMRLELAVLKEIAEFEGLYPDKNLNLKNEIVIKNFDASKLTQRQIDRVIAGEDIATVLMSPNE